MFTGLVEGVGTVVVRTGRRLTIRTPFALKGFPRGGSLSVGGCCLSAIRLGRGTFTADLSPETLRLTTLGTLKKGDPVNVERPVTLARFLGGHLVQGHVDGIGRVTRIRSLKNCKEFEFQAPGSVTALLVPKGSIAVDGVSLTVNGVRRGKFTVMIIPETLRKTVFGSLAVGSRVNLEVDIIAKYVKKSVSQMKLGGSS